MVVIWARVKLLILNTSEVVNLRLTKNLSYCML